MNSRAQAMRSRPSRPAARQRGFTMVEALVALVVLAIGLLGIAALYLDSLRAGRTAIYRTQAVNLAADLADRVRANRSAVLGYAVDFAEIPDAVDECLTSDGCSAAEMAATDLALWKADVTRTLPGGDASVAVVAPAAAGDPATYLVTIRWNEAGEDAALEFQLGFST
jgi:type IV pilus assembly protein PilV